MHRTVGQNVCPSQSFSPHTGVGNNNNETLTLQQQKPLVTHTHLSGQPGLGRVLGHATLLLKSLPSEEGGLCLCVWDRVTASSLWGLPTAWVPLVQGGGPQLPRPLRGGARAEQAHLVTGGLLCVPPKNKLESTLSRAHGSTWFGKAHSRRRSWGLQLPNGVGVVLSFTDAQVGHRKKWGSL